MKKTLFGAALILSASIPAATPATANLCETEHVAHALKTLKNECNKVLTSTGDGMASSSSSCVSQLDEDMTQLADPNFGTYFEDNVCAAAENVVQRYAAENNVDLLDD